MDSVSNAECNARMQDTVSSEKCAAKMKEIRDDIIPKQTLMLILSVIMAMLTGLLGYTYATERSIGPLQTKCAEMSVKIETQGEQLREIRCILKEHTEKERDK